MKTIKMLFGAALVGGVLSTSALAYTEQASAWPQAARPGVPTVAKVVNPTRLPQRFEGSTINVSLTVDAKGQPHNIKLLNASDADLVKSLTAAVAQWEFTPVQKNGVPVATKVVLPLKLISGT
jgi:TonB family protein